MGIEKSKKICCCQSQRTVASTTTSNWIANNKIAVVFLSSRIWLWHQRTILHASENVHSGPTLPCSEIRWKHLYLDGQQATPRYLWLSQQESRGPQHLARGPLAQHVLVWGQQMLKKLRVLQHWSDPSHLMMRLKVILQVAWWSVGGFDLQWWSVCGFVLITQHTYSEHTFLISGGFVAVFLMDCDD